MISRRRRGGRGRSPTAVWSRIVSSVACRWTKTKDHNRTCKKPRYIVLMGEESLGHVMKVLVRALRWMPLSGGRFCRQICALVGPATYLAFISSSSIVFSVLVYNSYIFLPRARRVECWASINNDSAGRAVLRAARSKRRSVVSEPCLGSRGTGSPFTPQNNPTVTEHLNRTSTQTSFGKRGMLHITICKPFWL